MAASANSSQSWLPYRPSDEHPWNLRRVVHLHHRAGFAATWREIQRDLKDGPDAAIDRLLQGKSRIDGVPDDFARMADVIGDAAVGSNNPSRLKAWWIYRFLFTPDPLTEKLALLWHNHFATSNLKVEDLAMMRRQNELFRKHAKAPFGQLLRAVVRDPAMLVWLDADSNRKGSPNENLAREIMELFTLGIGNYKEQDVKEAARALTGWTVRKNQFQENDQAHDAGRKTILGQTGRWRGDDFVRLLLQHPATSRRLAWRVCDLLLGEGAVDAASRDVLAEGLRERNLDVGWAVETVLRSRAFFANKNIAARVSSPIEFAIGAARALECFQPPPSTLLSAEWSARMGQDLFYPPNVGGWSGGRDWLSSRYVIARANYAAALVEGTVTARSTRPDLGKLIERHRGKRGLTGALTFFDQLLLGGRLTDALRERLHSRLQQRKGTEQDRIRWAAALLLALPESQLV